MGFHTSDQHKEVSHARKERDKKDITSSLSFVTDRNPFLDDPSLRNIDTGATADSRVNADITKEISTNIIQSMSDQNIPNFTFKISQQVITLSTKTSIKIDGEPIQVDPQLLFRRLTTTANTRFDDQSDIFKYELCCFPSSLFDSGGFLREAHKSSLADAIWDLGDCGVEKTDDSVDYVQDGGSLLQRIPWTKGDLFSTTCMTYVNYVTKKYPKLTVVFDGYPDKPSTKDITHMRRTRGATFNENMPCKTKKEVFLSNTVFS